MEIYDPSDFIIYINFYLLLKEKIKTSLQTLNASFIENKCFYYVIFCVLKHERFIQQS